jgi:hypothetical protein
MSIASLFVIRPIAIYTVTFPKPSIDFGTEAVNSSIYSDKGLKQRKGSKNDLRRAITR